MMSRVREKIPIQTPPEESELYVGVGLVRSRSISRSRRVAPPREEPIGLSGPSWSVQDKAIDALQRAATFNPPAPPWSVAWLTGQVNKQNGFLDEAIANFKSIVEGDDAATREREFDFSQDYNLLNELGQTIYERAKQERGEARQASQQALLREAQEYFARTLVLDPENDTAHYNLSLIFRQLGDPEKAQSHLALYRKYKPDDNARDRAIAIARSKDPGANHAAEAVVIYDLSRPEAYENDTVTRKAKPYELQRPANLAHHTR
jgi:tetratricopeptide (TPR) repeat protein